MSSYFDELSSKMREQQNLPPEQFLDFARALEDQVVAEVSLVTGDREFPEDLREAIQRVIATQHLYPRDSPLFSKQVEDELLLFRRSNLFESLHDLFHVVARRRIETRFGLLYDSPSGILKLREEHDQEDAEWRASEALWSKPGGKVEPSQDQLLLDAVRRESTFHTHTSLLCNPDCPAWTTTPAGKLLSEEES